jgi:hypothetical protein
MHELTGDNLQGEPNRQRGRKTASQMAFALAGSWATLITCLLAACQGL